jgi:hypothetical protein
MNVCAWIVTMIVLCIIVYIIALLLVDCDLGLAWASKVGKPIGEIFSLMTVQQFLANQIDSRETAV